jgi:hypothetical protein
MKEYDLILNRIIDPITSPSFEHSSSVLYQNPGWKNIILKLDELLSHLSPNYSINQIDSVSGELRYYANFQSEIYDTNPDLSKEIFNCVIAYYEYRSINTCNKCAIWQ